MDRSQDRNLLRVLPALIALPFAVLGVFALLFSTSARAQTPSDLYASPDSEVYRTFSAILDGYYAAWSQSAEAGLSFYADTPELRIWDGTPVSDTGLEPYAQELIDWFSTLDTANSARQGELQVMDRGDLVITVSEFRSTATAEGAEDYDEVLRQTLVWTKVGGMWRVIHEHSSPYPGE